MTLAEKSAKLLEYSVILKAADKKNWVELLPKMSDKQVQTLYGVLVDEVKAWKKEGISIVPDMAIEMSLLPQEQQPGTSISALKSRLEGKTPPAQLPKPAPAKPGPTTSFAKELEREVNTPEITPSPGTRPSAPPAIKPSPPPPIKLKLPVEENPVAEPVFGEIKPDLPNPDKNAWMISNKVVVPKSTLGEIKPQPLSVPKIRNRVAKHGLTELGNIKTVDDLGKIEAAHLRQGPLMEQITFIKQRIAQIARDNDLLPISIIPVFEQSPLFQSYLKAGSLMIEHNSGEDRIVLDQVMGEMEAMGQDTLSQQEFEAVADLKKELETLAGL